jgi:hypothetical protein
MIFSCHRIVQWSNEGRWARHVERMGARRSAYKILLGKSEGKIPLGRRRRR